MKRVKEFKDLAGHTILSMVNNTDELKFTLKNGQKCWLYHDQDCCESVSINDVKGDFSVLVGSPLTKVIEEQSHENPPGLIKKEYEDESFTWTTYTFVTTKGSVTIRWYGSSNGYYSEDVNFRVE